ncbi:PAS domain S-box protein [Myxococcus sp. Y35]|uniref:PAS domain S-box protein n=1 Tax=Pseudomyxococcus flavus TaxID=3115648 RepID=UPI003CF8B41A
MKARAAEVAVDVRREPRLSIGDEKRSEVLFSEQLRRGHVSVDHLFAGLLFVQWMLAVAASILLSTNTWMRRLAWPLDNVHGALLLGAVLSGIPIVLARLRPGYPLTRHVIATAQLLWASVLVHVSGGRLDSYFYVTGSLAVLATYRDWKVLMTATCVVVLEHILRGWFLPGSVPGLVEEEWWLILEHVGWLALTNLFLVASIQRTLAELRHTARRQAQVEAIPRVLEQRVAERTAQLEEAQSLAHLGSWEWVPAEDRMHWSPEVYRICGVDPATFKPSIDKALALTQPRDREALRENLERLLREGGEFAREIQLVRPDGQCRHVLVRGRAGPDTSGTGVRLVGTNEDITERKLAEAALRASEAKYRQIVETAHEGIWVVDQDARTLFVNRRMAEMLGYAPHEMLGRPSATFLTPDSQQVREHLLKERSHTLDVKLRRKDGSELWTMMSTSAVLALDGSYAGALAMVSDITERKQMEERLQSSEALLKKAQELAHAGSWDWDLTTGQLVFSEELCRIFGLDPTQVPTTYDAFDTYVHPEDRDTVRRCLDVAIVNAAGCAVEFRIIRPDGALRTLSARCRATYDEFGRCNRMSGVTQDVTERKELEARLLVTDRMASLGTLASGVAHEINNPLAYVTSNLDYLAGELSRLERAYPGEDFQELAQVVSETREGAARIRRIVSDLKARSRSDTNEHELIDVEQVLAWSIKMAWNEIRHSARLVKDCGAVALVEGDGARLGQVFLNLLINAAQAIPSGRVDQNEIRLRTRMDDSGQVVIEVEDTGPGIPPEVRNRIFDPFFTTKAVGVGTGLGLTICHGIIKGMGGEITVSSEVGKGTTFRVVLPAAASAPRPDEHKKKKLTEVPPVGRRRILIVDDDAAVASSLRRLLAPEHDVEVALRGTEALQRMEAQAFDVIFCDLLMPEMTGMDLFDELKRTAPESANRMFFLTGGAFTQRAREFLDEHPDRYMEKPVDIEAVRRLVQELVSPSSGTAPEC